MLMITTWSPAITTCSPSWLIYSTAIDVGDQQSYSCLGILEYVVYQQSFGARSKQILLHEGAPDTQTRKGWKCVYWLAPKVAFGIKFRQKFATISSVVQYRKNYHFGGKAPAIRLVCPSQIQSIALWIAIHHQVHEQNSVLSQLHPFDLSIQPWQQQSSYLWIAFVPFCPV